jgi:p-aminobenzoyl-glutamate transporter AbgT
MSQAGVLSGMLRLFAVVAFVFLVGGLAYGFIVGGTCDSTDCGTGTVWAVVMLSILGTFIVLVVASVVEAVARRRARR